ncbi:MAG: cobalt-precorrin 5A hydrolase [Deltaproteobacteria bacterium]|nr:cobalt-precorrin 5A hydrolase [Deltaproteobacteria bacterium]
MPNREINTRVVALTPRGAALARDLCQGLPKAGCWLPKTLAAGDPKVKTFDRVAAVFQEAFQQGQNLVCIMAAGIVVRGIAPHLTGKDKDPAVVVVDEAGRFAISLLSGHLGGANELTRQVSQILNATPVITTASDVQGLPSLDLAAARAGLAIENLAAVSQVQMALLSGLKLRLVDPDGYLADVAAEYPDMFTRENHLDTALADGWPGVYVGFRQRAWPKHWLVLRPRNLVAGLGCHKGTPAAEILGFIKDTFKKERLSLASLKALATVELKKDEPGLKEAAARLGVEFIWFTKEELQEVEVPNPTPQLMRLVGVVSVSEAAALKAGGVELILTKRKGANATLAVAKVA